MCGIVGYVGKKSVVPIIIEGLRRLEYRGYDSAGIAVAGNGDGLQLRRAEGKLRNLEEAIRQKPLNGSYGIGHTRWATHGRPTEENAHPHRDCTGKIVVVHNGIVENYLSLKKKLTEEGHKFTTETDTEIIAHLVEKYSASPETVSALRWKTPCVKRSSNSAACFALAVISTDDPNKIVAARNGPPAVIGLGNDEYFVASDVPAILYHTRDIFFLATATWPSSLPDGVHLSDFDGRPVSAADTACDLGSDSGGKGRLQAFHAQGNLRAAARRPRHDAGPGLAGYRTHFSRRDADQRGRVSRRGQDQYHRLWHELACRASGQVHDRDAGPGPGGGGLCQRVALSQSNRRSEHDHAGDFAVRRDRRHDRGAARSQIQGIKDAG